MKCLLVLCLAVAFAMANQPIKQSWTVVHQGCQANPKTFVEEEVFEKLRKGEKVNLPNNFADHAFCMLKDMDLQEPNGNINTQTLKKAVQESVQDQAKINQITSECSANDQTPQKTALTLFKCLGKYHIDIGQF
ncbi:uncharacterized protein LOC132707649 [Cylas formicarius]|uniref:Odorant binding protein n=1 Tax=Cylas formicarius TaxID=197179 RepID=A0A6B7MBL6_CYLFO|nr:uncharacterized protein LOC132707649 [Cylas formicarius]QFO46772.1 odorant binding protein [Cylas formicarius]